MGLPDWIQTLIKTNDDVICKAVSMTSESRRVEEITRQVLIDVYNEKAERERRHQIAVQMYLNNKNKRYRKKKTKKTLKRDNEVTLINPIDDELNDRAEI